MLIQHRVATTGSIEEIGAEVTVGQGHGHRTGQHRHRGHQQISGDQPGPAKQRHFHQPHARRAHVEYGGDDVDRSHDRRHTQDVYRENGEIHCRAGLRGKRRIHGPAHARAAARHELRGNQQRRSRRQQPERQVVHTRERHVGRTDLHRDQPVRKSHERRHDRPEHHDQSVISRHRVEFFRRQYLQARLKQFGSDQHRHRTADHEHREAEPQIHGADVFVVGRTQPAHHAVGLMRMRVIIVSVSSVVCVAMTKGGVVGSGAHRGSDFIR